MRYGKSPAIDRLLKKSDMQEFVDTENPPRSPLRDGFSFSRLLTLLPGRLILLEARSRSPLRLRAPIASDNREAADSVNANCYYPTRVAVLPG